AIPKVLIGSPIHQKPAILREFLHSLSELQCQVDFYFIDDNVDIRSKEMLQLFQKNREKQSKIIIQPSTFVDQYVKTEHNHQWNEHLIWKVAKFKDSIIEYARLHQYDYL